VGCGFQDYKLRKKLEERIKKKGPRIKIEIYGFGIGEMEKSRGHG